MTSPSAVRVKESLESLPTSEGPMDVHCFVPDTGGSARLPAIIVIQEAFGVNPHIKRLCRRIASAGYATFSPELFHRTGRGLGFGYDEFPKIKPILGSLTNGQVLDDLRATHRHVIGRADVDAARVASWGFCFGGWASVLAACNLPLAAAVSFYGGGLVHQRPGFGISPLIDEFGSMHCPVLLVFGGKDTGIPPADIGAVQSRLESLGKDHEVEIYPEGGHGFFCEDRPVYDRLSAEAAWERTTTWLTSKLH
jgi:carboxymethylenebutenolidase